MMRKVASGFRLLIMFVSAMTSETVNRAKFMFSVDRQRGRGCKLRSVVRLGPRHCECFRQCIGSVSCFGVRTRVMEILGRNGASLINIEGQGEGWKKVRSDIDSCLCQGLRVWICVRGDLML